MKLSMPGYVKKVLKQLNYLQSSNKCQDSPSPFVPPKFGSGKPQMPRIAVTYNYSLISYLIHI